MPARQLQEAEAALYPGADATPSENGEGAAAPRVILTPDQRVRASISSTLEELADERAAARRAVRRLHLVPVWYESGAHPHPPRSMYQADVEQSHGWPPMTARSLVARP